MRREDLSPTRRVLAMASLILAGEAIFIPPFHLGRYFKSSLLATFGIDEYQLGELGALYGLVAMACYAVGGPLADRFSPRRLLAVSLLATGAGSLYMATIPGLPGLRALFGFWGASTILAFWAPLIRATREWGGDLAQGRAFGLLDGGRGLAAAVIAAGAAYGFSAWYGDEALLDPAQETAAVRTLLWFYAGCCAFAAACVVAFVPDSPTIRTDASLAPTQALRWLGEVARLPAVWGAAVVIVAAYSAYKTFDYYGLFAEDAYGLSKSQSANLVTWLSFLRVGGALAAGWIADRWLGVSGTVAACFGVLAVAYSVFLAAPVSAGWAAAGVANMAVSAVAFFALRGVYFALLEESSVPRRLTGSAVGVVSLVGFTPEIFMPPLTGWLIRSARQAGDVLVGYHQLFALLAVMAAVGAVASLWLRRRAAD